MSLNVTIVSGLMKVMLTEKCTVYRPKKKNETLVLVLIIVFVAFVPW